MNKHTNSRSLFAAISTFLLVAMLAIGALYVRKAQADETTLTRHALPTSEPSLVKDPSTLTGENWMSGISGSLFLHEINVPGTHDSCMWDPYTDITAAKTQYGYARTQTKDMSIQAQLKAGVRLFDIRLTNVRNSSFIKVMFGPERLRTSGTQGLYPVHGAHKGWLGNWRFYGDQKKGVLTFDTLMGWYTEFLRKHPTETLILDINYESDSGDKNTTLSRAREKLNKFYNEKNPSTGKPYIYMENGNKVVASMPSLADCRGQIVVMSCDDLHVGMHYDWTRDWNPKTIGGIHFAVENHYEATKDDKVKYLDALIKGGSVGNQTFSDPVGGATQQIPRSADDTPLARSIVASTGSNRPLAVTSSPHQSPKEIADVVMPRMYGNVGTLTSVGTHYGWIMSDFVTNDTVKTFWKTNFPSDMVYATVTYTAPAEMGYEDQTFNVLSGSEITLPSNPFVRENETLAARARRLSSKKSRIVGWAIDDEEYRPGATITVFDNATITAILSDQESAHNLLSSQNSESIKAETLATGLSGSSKEEVIAETQNAIDETKLHASGEEQPSNAATHTVAFVDEDSAESEAIPESQMVEEGSVATRPADPKREHAEFVGWYTDLNVELSDEESSAIEEDADLSALVWVIGNKARVLYDFDDPVNADVMLYARWDRKECSVTYMDQGDELYTDIVYEGDNAEDLQFDEVD